ncbi:hypothetical protein GEV33_012687 [Tenebrio molitor]|uniref:Uncharacterized protein n=1 Tax=Tenebrio molitor TaxID=7067 RepID=A0A8J6H8N5_TENMO|nr:hypothetical protein GEV33_012687 [Tenebrio molitor]
MTEIDWSRGGASSGVEVVVLLHRSNNCILTRCEYEKILHFPGRFRLASPQIRMRASFWCGVRTKTIVSLEGGNCSDETSLLPIRDASHYLQCPVRGLKELQKKLENRKSPLPATDGSAPLSRLRSGIGQCPIVVLYLITGGVAGYGAAKNGGGGVTNRRLASRQLPTPLQSAARPQKLQSTAMLDPRAAPGVFLPGQAAGANSVTGSVPIVLSALKSYYDRSRLLMAQMKGTRLGGQRRNMLQVDSKYVTILKLQDLQERVFWDKLGDLVVIVDCLNRPVAPRTSSGAPRAVRVNETRRPRYRISILKDAPSVDIL